MAYNIMLMEPSQIKPGDRLILGIEGFGWEPPRTAKVVHVTAAVGDGWITVDVERPSNTPCSDYYSFPQKRLVLVAVHHIVQGEGD